MYMSSFCAFLAAALPHMRRANCPKYAFKSLTFVNCVALGALGLENLRSSFGVARRHCDIRLSSGHFHVQLEYYNNDQISL